MGKRRIQRLAVLSVLAAGMTWFSQPTTARPAAAEADKPALPAAWVDALHWRCIGPANMGGRITDLTVYEADANIWWAATASGGLLKTTNNGVTFEHQFDRENTVSIGDVAVAPSDPDIVWVGTGENNPRNSVSWGDGVYKSTDGGKTWTHMGLKESFQIGRIVIHPEDPNTVYVGALGRLWGDNEQRGLYRTTDGGETWKRILYVDERTGVIDVAMHPQEPQTLIVATYERQRDGFDSNDPKKKNGPGSGVYRTTDGGETFTHITEGLPEGNLGRIGLDFYRNDPAIVYAVIESEKTGQEPENAPYTGLRGEDADVGARLTEIVEGGPAAEAGLQVGDIVIGLEETTVHSYDDLMKAIRRHLAGDTVRLEVSRDRKSVLIELTFAQRPGEEEDAEEESPRGQRQRSRQRRSPFSSGLGGQRENLQDQQGPEGHQFGGVYRSSDAGATWTRINSVNPRPMYFSQIRVDPADANHIYVLGIALYRSKDGGETFTDDGGRGTHVDHHAMWIDPVDGRHIILGNDGGIYVTFDRMENWDHLNHVAIGQFYHVGVSPQRDYMVYGGLQDNGSWGGPNLVRSGSGPVNADWRFIGGGDGFICRVDPDDPDQVYFAGQNGGLGRYNLRTGERGFMRPRAPRGTRYRFNWKTPYILSRHNSGIYNTAGNFVFRSLKRGDDLKAISPEITNTDEGSATALAECPFDGDVLYVGTDDGALWRTRDGGHEWTRLLGVDRPAEPSAAEGEEEEAGRAQPPAEPPPARPSPSRAARMIQALIERDANGDGMIQKDEVGPRMMRLFDRADGNGDGVIDAAELKAIAERPAPPPAVQPPPAGGAEPPAEEREEPQAAAVDEPPVQEPEEPAESEEEEAEEAVEAAAPIVEDPISGRWQARVVGEELPPGEGRFSFTIRLAPDGKVTGTFQSDIGEGPIRAGAFDAETGKLIFAFATEQMDIEFSAMLAGSELDGEMVMGGGAFSLGFEARRVDSAAEPTEPAGAEAPKEPAAHEWQALEKLLPGPRWISSLETSRAKEGRIYITFDGHRSDDDEPYVFVSEDHGEKWRSIRANLPTSAGPTRVIREDRENPDLLYLGTEFGAWCSIDRGGSWTRLRSNLPTVAVHEFAQHPTSGEIVAATHGRSLWILDVTPLRQMTAAVIAERVHLYRPSTAVYWRDEPSRGETNRAFVGENPPSEAQFFYSISGNVGTIGLQITDQAGETIRELPADGGPGLHRASWDLRRPTPPGRSGRYRRGPRIEPGTYLVELKVDNLTMTQPLVVEGDPEYRDVRLWGEEYDERQEQLHERDEEDD